MVWGPKSKSSVVHRRRAESPLRGAANLGKRFPARLPSGHAHHSRPHADREHPAANLVARAAGNGTSAIGPANRHYSEQRPSDIALEAQIKSFETAFGMQREAPEAFDLTHETDATLKLYGLERGHTDSFGWQCLIARRLAERGVRFIELIDTGSSNNWDSHGNMLDHVPLAKNVDLPIAGLFAI